MEKWGWMVSINSLCDEGRNIILRDAWMRANLFDFLNTLAYISEKGNN